MPWAADAVYPEVIEGRPVGPRGHAVYSGWVNAAALPALSLPVDPAPDGMPIGLHLVAGFGRDDGLLDLAEAMERRRPFADRWPALPEPGRPAEAAR
jgi:aspartyl-tRNA(Asn)/glutamyl-tRNA(Gln) amidotransferase subunit A